MKYFNCIQTGFTVALNEETGEFSGITRAPSYKKIKEFSGIVGRMSDREELIIDAILEDSFDRRTREYKATHKALLPGWWV